MFDNVPLWPARASTTAGNVDALYIFLVVLSTFMSVAIFLMILTFAARYRRRPGHAAEQIEGSTILEITWSVIPFGIFVVIFVWGAVIFFQERTPPRGATEIYVVAKQWMWKLEHEEGHREINELHVPVGRDVKMILTSQDVIHSFYVPAFRIKQDVVPGRYTTAWFRPTRPGTYHLFCAEYCGTQHSGMIGQVVVMEPSQYEAWLGGGGATGTAFSANCAPTNGFHFGSTRGSTKSFGRVEPIALSMNRCQIEAGKEPPVTLIPWTETIGISARGYPTQTVASRLGV